MKLCGESTTVEVGYGHNKCEVGWRPASARVHCAIFTTDLLAMIKVVCIG